MIIFYLLHVDLNCFCLIPSCFDSFSGRVALGWFSLCICKLKNPWKGRMNKVNWFTCICIYVSLFTAYRFKVFMGNVHIIRETVKIFIKFFSPNPIFFIWQMGRNDHSVKLQPISKTFLIGLEGAYHFKSFWKLW